MKDNLAILVVDDEAIVVLSIQSELRHHFKDRFTYEIAYSAEEALEVIADLYESGVRIILVISDWLMPGMKGDAFLSVVKERHREVKTIMVTGHADQAVLDRLLRDGITNEVIKKPWDRDDLIRRVEGCVDSADCG